MRHMAWIVLPVGLLLSACSSPQTSPTADAAQAPLPEKASAGPQASPEEAAVLDAVRTYLAEVRQMDVTKMTLGLRDLKVNGDSAECVVDFGLKEAPGAPAMTYAYTLSRKDGRWAVSASRPADGTGHGAVPSGGASMPGGHPRASGADPHGMAAGHSDPADLPAGHPPVAPAQPPSPSN
ncbi:MAG: hypothetical protein ACOYXN_06935 [Acidobacteriota bacterium]